MQRPRLRDNQGKGPFELYPLGQIPDDVIYNIAKWMTYHFAVGKSDITGDDWGDIFAKAIGGGHLDKPLGLADVIYEGMAWSTKSFLQYSSNHIYWNSVSGLLPCLTIIADNLKSIRKPLQP